MFPVGQFGEPIGGVVESFPIYQNRFVSPELVGISPELRRFMRSERPERAGKSPAELLSGTPHPHWLEMLGHVRFCRN